MDSSAATEEFDPARPPSSLHDAPTEIQRPPIPMIPAGREQCSACNAPLASDQRYCVECGQRRGGARPPFFGEPQMGPPSTGAVRARRPLMSINATLVAGVGTLLLAMGIGILIGRSGQGTSTKTPAVQLISPSGSALGAGAGSTATETPAVGAQATSTTGASSSKSSSSTSSSKPAPKKSPPPPPKVVTVGSKGSGPGYQKGKFTGNFFGEGEK